VTEVSEPRAARTQSVTQVARADTYAVEANDSLWLISQKLYGNGAYFKALEAHNKTRYPRAELIKAGDVIQTPALEVLTQKYPHLCPRADHLPTTAASSGLASQRGTGRIYVVEEGDTLFDIARFELGKATRWIEIYEMNKQTIGEDFNHLRPGTQLMLPTEQRDDNFTRRPGASISR
jgi:nucleoid-associated protein YgaU